MALWSSPSTSSSPKRIVITMPALVLTASVAAVFFFFLLSSLSSPRWCWYCACGLCRWTQGWRGGGRRRRGDMVVEGGCGEWVKDQIRVNGLHMQDNVLRKGINPRTRTQQLEDLLQSIEVVGLYFIRYLNPGHFHCLERDELSLMAAFRYGLPSKGLLHKHPLIVKGYNMDFSRFGSDVVYDLIYASAVFLHMPDKLVWVGLERLTNKLKPYDGRIFVSHNMKFCSRLGGDECTKQLTSLGLEYVGKHTHASLLFNHYEI